MVETFQEKLPAINAEVVASVIRARNSVQAPSPSADSRKFWRVIPNWSLDSDGDGTPDWLEFDLIARNQSNPDAGTGGNGGGGPNGDPFSGDTNHNGIPDGDELDSDGDGIVDKNDASKADDLVSWTKNEEMRFAWFHVQLPAEGKKIPRQINDQGRILFEKGIWHNGTLSEFAVTGTNLTNCRPLALGDSGKVIGTGLIDLPGDDSSDAWNCMVMWGTLGAVPTVLKQGDVYPNALYTLHQGMYADMNLTEDDQFAGYVYLKKSSTEDGTLHYYLEQPAGNPRKAWKVTNGNLVETHTLPGFANWVDAQGESWGDLEGRFSTTLGGGSSHQFDGAFSRSVSLPGGGSAVFAGYGFDRPFEQETMDPPSSQFRTDDGWRGFTAGTSLSDAVDFSTDGRFSINRSFRIWHNGKREAVAKWSPGLSDDWQSFTRNILLDTTRHGWTLAVQKNDENPIDAAKAMAGTPLFLETPTPSEGLDAVSFTSNRGFNSGLAGTTEEFWIMVPAGGDIPVRIRSGACPATPITFGGGTGSKVTASPSSVASTNTVVTFSAPADADGTEEVVNIKLGELDSLSKPLRAKIMKPRVVKVSVWQLKKKPSDPDPAIPQVEEFEEYLNDIYKKQINVTFDVTIHPPSDSGLADNVPFRINEPPSAAQETVSKGKNIGNIQVYAMGGNTVLLSDPPGSMLEGISNPDSNRIWMSVSNTANGTFSQRNAWLSTVSHEIGHILFGEGHPNRNDGRAPLPGTDHEVRLMHSGSGLIGPSTQRRVCVKAEWDRAETWLKSNVDK